VLGLSAGTVIATQPVAAAVDHAAPTAYGVASFASSDKDQLAPGVVHTSFTTKDGRGRVQGDLLRVDLDTPGLSVHYLSAGAVSARAPLSAQLVGPRVVAAVNGDFFDIHDTGAPLGVGIDREDGLLHGPSTGWNSAAVIGRDGLGRLAEVHLDGTVVLPGGATVALSNLNSPTVARGGIGLYTVAWKRAPRPRVVDGVADVREVLLREGRVVAVGTRPGTGALASGEMALIGREQGAAALAGLVVGDAVEVRYGARSNAVDIAVALTGNRVLVTDGVAAPLGNTVLAPRTAIGFSADGRDMILVTVDGRQKSSRGLSEREIGQLMRDLGADDALNLDGGGSSTMLARDGDDSAPKIVNSPSGGAERHIPNGLGVNVATG
jgi:hypothetical protein